MEKYAGRSRSYLDTMLIFRQVSGGDALVAAATEIGKRIFGSRSVGLLELPDHEQSAYYGMRLNSITDMTLPVVKVVDPDDLVLRMFERTAPAERHYAGGFRYAVNKLTREASRAYRPISRGEDDASPRYRTSGLYETLSSIGLNYGVLDQSDIDIRVQGLVNVMGNNGEGARLSVMLHPTDNITNMLMKQAEACQAGLAQHSARVGYPLAPHLVHIPLCTLPSGASQEQGDNFVELMDRTIAGYTLKAGGVETKVF